MLQKSFDSWKSPKLEQKSLPMLIDFYQDFLSYRKQIDSIQLTRLFDPNIVSRIINTLISFTAQIVGELSLLHVVCNL